MKARVLFIATVVFFGLLLETGLAIGNPAVRSPVGSGTVPPSGVRSGLIRSPNPIDTSGNLVVTGNVVGGRHFRGIVPYNAVSGFRSRLGSTSLDSFLRRSAGSGYSGMYTGAFKPYYSPTGTVTTTRPGWSGVFTPPAVRIDSRTPDEFSLEAESKKQGLYGQDARLLYDRGIKDRRSLQKEAGWELFQIQDSAFEVSRPMSMTPQELEEVILSEVDIYSLKRRPTSEQDWEQQREQFRRRDLRRVSDRAAELKRPLIEKDNSLQPSTKKKPGEEAPQAWWTEKRWLPEEQMSKEDSGLTLQGRAELEPELDVFEQMKQQLDDLQKVFERMSAAQENKEAPEAKSRIWESGEAVGSDKELTEQSLHFVEPSKTIKGVLAKPTLGRKKGAQEGSETRFPVLGKLSDVELSVRAAGILGEHKSFASFSEDKFNQHIRAAEDYLKQGKYYRAADAYTLASIYKSNDPLAYAGKSHALFAAGEYMSSALFLSKALKIFPEYARFRINLEAMVGDRDKLESRIVDVERWLKRSNAPELQFLLGYVYYQMDRPDRAKEAIDAAYKEMPDSSAVIALRKAIDVTVKSY